MRSLPRQLMLIVALVFSAFAHSQTYYLEGTDINYYERSIVLVDLFSNLDPAYKVILPEYDSAILAAKANDISSFRSYYDDFTDKMYGYDEASSDFSEWLNKFTIKTDFEHNPFLAEYMDSLSRIRSHIQQMNSELEEWAEKFNLSVEFDAMSRVDGLISDVTGEQLEFENSILSNFNRLQSDMINALSNMVAERFREEAMNLALMSLFRTMVKEDSVLVSHLFPKTYLYLNTLLDAGSFYGADLTRLRQIIYMDVYSLDDAFDSEKFAIFKGFNDHPNQRALFTMANHFLDNSQSYRYHDILYLDVLKDSAATTRYADWLTFMRSLSETIEVTNSPTTWIDIDALVPPTKLHSDTVNIFYGLLYSKLAISANWENHLNDYHKEQAAQEIFLLLDPFHDAKLDFKFGSEAEDALDVTLNSTQQAINYYRRLCAHPVVQDSFGISPSTFDLADHTLELVRAFRYQKYTEAVNLMSLYFIDYLGGHLKNIHSISFLLEFYQVKDAREMQNLIESYALPVGSSSVKRNSRFNVAINAYAGLTGGQEIAYGSLGNQTKWNVGLTAPVGVSTTFGHGYWTVFAGVIDLGSIVNQRLNNDTTSYSGLKFENFLSPGLGLFYNIKSTPVTLGASYNFIPNLRTITYDTGQAIVTETNTNVSRINFSVLIDIPLFNLYHRK